MELKDFDTIEELNQFIKDNKNINVIDIKINSVLKHECEYDERGNWIDSSNTYVEHYYFLFFELYKRKPIPEDPVIDLTGTLEEKKELIK
jgi:hypothetical protein